MKMTLQIVAVRGHSTWWIWAIRDTAGALIEESRTQFRSAAAAEVQGRARISEFEARRAIVGLRPGDVMPHPPQPGETPA